MKGLLITAVVTSSVVGFIVFLGAEMSVGAGLAAFLVTSLFTFIFGLDMVAKGEDT